MRASSTLKRDAGTSVFSWRAESALRTRARRSAIGSDRFMFGLPSPRRLRHARDVAPEREVPEADPAEAELPEIGARPAAALAAVALAGLEFQLRIRLDDCSATSHRCALSLSPERHAELPEEHASPVVRAGRGDDRDVETPGLFDLGRVDLEENEVVLDAQGVVPAPVERAGRHAPKVA